ncbi:MULTISPECIES: response regulator transcription factor [Pseudomonas]|jgi:two-component system, NarL family, response regulator EvgA|uniref:response regulator transcription factor n=1 Tax=Pseudomonas TaxID=286 RepID=UPI00099D78FF|nr:MULTISPECIES: response regulator transcription factor [Pseudomonas]MCK3838868.1 response regulator transcription factor [Pseudomonas sp. NCIMB 10586]OPB05925.1 DNA-binding response regulator [Pseudomonas synxantha]VCU67861.1 Virulence factors putative positive transcription regulator BvgA [Pseudomonas synxantha]
MRPAMIVDDHPFIRSSLKALLQQADYQVIAEADNGADALQLAIEHEPELIILDISMPKLDGLMVLRRLGELDLPSKILVLTSHPAEFFALRCMKAGASGFVSKTQDPAELLKAINAISSGYTFFPQKTIVSVNRNEVEVTEQVLLKELSNRELNILLQLANGLDNKQIGEYLLLSNKTVSTYKARIIEKLGVSSVVHLAEMVKRHGLL